MHCLDYIIPNANFKIDLETRLTLLISGYQSITLEVTFKQGMSSHLFPITFFRIWKFRGTYVEKVIL